MTHAADIRPLIPESSTSESTSVEVVLNDLRAGLIEIPDYQRDSDQWSDPTKSLLIESVINNLSIPAFFFEVARNADGLEINQVIDGQQRLTTLDQFYQKRLRLVSPDEAPYISPHSIHYAGKTFDELPAVYQQSFRRYRLAVIKLRDLAEMRLEVFRRINQGGTPLSGQDIRLAYYGEASPSLAFIRLVGIYDAKRHAANRFSSTAQNKYGLANPWTAHPNASLAWFDLWDDKELARGQTASEMFLFAILAARHGEIDNIIQNGDALAKLGVRFNKSLDEVLDVACAQYRYQDGHPDRPPLLPPLAELQSRLFPYFATWIEKLTSFGPSLGVQKHRMMAITIGAAYRCGIDPHALDLAGWGRAIELVRQTQAICEGMGETWPQSRGRWDGPRGHRAQLAVLERVVGRLLT
jgi:hypothetical protein